MISNLFNTIFFEPIFGLLVFIYENVAFNNLGLSIIILTVIIRVVLLPFFYKGAKDQALVQRIQPHVEKIRKDHKDNKEKQVQALMALYKEHKLNPFSGLLILIIQLPIFIALFHIFRSSDLIIETFDNPLLFGLINLGEASVILAIAAAGLQYLQGKVALSKRVGKTKDPLAGFGAIMVYFAPILSFVILISLPSALALYWVVSTIFSLGQQIVINKRLAYIDDPVKLK